MHSDPSFVWSLDFLAEQLDQSRSNFSRKFVLLVGMAPMRYLMNWRMQLASRMMLTTHDNIAQIAEKVGYESQAAFSRVFKRTFGVTPTEYRETVLRPKNI